MMPSDAEYQGHRVFSVLEEIATFYDRLAFSVMRFPTIGTRSAISIDTYVLSSICGTLRSIRHVVAQGQINDGFALLRKYFDAVLVNIYTNLYLEDNVSMDSFVVERVTNWVGGREALPPYREVSRYIKSSARLAPITALLYGNDRYQKIRERCNDNTHYNFYINVMLNDGDIYLKDRLRWIELMSDDAEDIFILHFAYLFTIRDYYMASSDYIDSLEFGEAPIDGSQYWVAQFVRSAFERLKGRRPDVANEIRSSTCMELEA